MTKAWHVLSITGGTFRRVEPDVAGSRARSDPVSRMICALAKVTLLLGCALAGDDVAALTAQSITFATLANKTFGIAPFTVSATASSGLPVSFLSLTTPVCTVNGSTVTIVAAGTCTIRASQAGDAIYDPAPNVDRSFTVAKASQTITFAALSGKTYGASPFAVSATASSGLPVAFSSTTTAVCTVSSATVTIVAVGTCTVRASQAGNTNYNAAPNVNRSFAVAKASQTISFAALPNVPYSLQPIALGATSTSGLVVSFVSTTTTTCTVSGAALTLVRVGTCSVRASQSGNGNYNAATSVTRSFAIQKASQTITFASIPDKSLSDPPFAITATSTSGLPVEFVSNNANVCSEDSGVVTVLAIGTCPIMATQWGDVNYLAAPTVIVAFNVIGSQTIAFDPIPNQAINVGPVALHAVTTSGLPVAFASLTPAVCTVAGAAVTPVALGSCTVQATQTGNGTFQPALPVNQSFSVLQSQTINFPALTNVRIGTMPPTLFATASSGLPVAFASLTPPTCTVAGSSIALVAQGTCTIRASQSGNGSFAVAPNVDRSFVVLPPPTVQYLYDAAGNVVGIQRL